MVSLANFQIKFTSSKSKTACKIELKVKISKIIYYCLQNNAQNKLNGQKLIHL